VKPKTTGRRLTSLRNFAKWAGVPNPLEDYIAPTPGRAIPHPLPEGLQGVQRMIDHAKNHEQAAIVGLCGFAGLRISEALSSTVQMLDVQSMLLEVRGKGDKTRIVPISNRAWSSISSAYVLAASKPNKELISYKDRFARKIVTNLGVKAGISVPVSSHDLRATFATHVYNQTRNLRLVQELLGHANSSQTEVYTGIMMKSMQEAVEL
jgi:site-specific recombinase XerD